MQSSAVGYYADFLVYPLVLVGLALVPVATDAPTGAMLWLLAAAIGAFLWTFAEYVIHRVVLHNVGYFRDLHDQHHASPTALIGTPIWLSFSLLALVVFVPSCWLLGLNLGSGFTFGLTAGYLTYSFMHHVLHHWRILPGSPLYGIKHRHALHHHRHDEGNFGVTSLFWDHVFGTALKSRSKTRKQA